MRKLLLVAGLAGLLGGCDTVLSRLPGAAPARTVTIADPEAPRMQVAIPARGADTLVSLVARNGDVETWLAVDDISVSFRQGVLVATRGLGHDLMGAGAETTLAALAGMGEAVYRRQMRYLTGEHHTTYLTAGCSMSPAGTETVGTLRLQRHEETCEARDHRFTNVFWSDGAGRILRSRQWVSPEVGYLVTNLTG